MVLKILQNYSHIQGKYQKSNKDYIYIAQGVVIVIAIAYLFYDNLFAGLIMSPIIPIYLKMRKKEDYNRKLNVKKVEFSDGMQAVSFALNTGYSIENAFVQASGELELLYGQNSDIVKEFCMIVRRIKRNENLEDIMEDYARKVNVDDISYFAGIFRYAKRSGGDIPEIIRQTSKIIHEKAEVQNEIDTIISGRKLEQKVMTFIPFGIILYLRLTSGTFMEVLYGNVAGIIIMSICLLVYILAVLLSKKIVDIKV